MKYRIYTVLLAYLFCSPTFAQSDPSQLVDTLIKQEMEMKGIPGLAFAVIKNNKVIEMNTYGYANLDHATPTTRETVFPIASIDKQIIATCIMMMHEQGKLNIEDPVTKYLDSIPSSWKDIKIRHLMSHTSGLHDNPIEYHNGRGYDRYTSHDIFKYIIKQDIVHPTDMKFLYSDAGFFLLQQIFEKASGYYYPTFIVENIFRPLGMINTRLLEPTEIVPGRTVSYYKESNDKLYINVYRQISLGPHFGDVGTTIEDFVKYDAAINTNKLLRTESYDLMWTPARVNGSRMVSQLEDENDLFDATSTYGLGWELGNFLGHRVVYHSGFTGTSITKFPEQGLTVLLLTNLTYRPVFSPNALARKIASFYLTKKGFSETRNSKDLPTVKIENILEHLKKEQPDTSLYEDQFYEVLLRALPNYNRKIARFGTLNQLTYAYTTTNNGANVQTFRANHQLGDLLYHVTLNNDGLISLISIEQ